jgi:hypothetical protein
MKESRSHAANELKAGFREQDLIRASERLINDYLAGTIPRSETGLLVDEFERMVQEKYPNLERTGCPGSHALKELATGKTRRRRTIEHIKKCWPCLGEHNLLLRNSFKKSETRLKI